MAHSSLQRLDDVCVAVDWEGNNATVLVTDALLFWRCTVSEADFDALNCALPDRWALTDFIHTARCAWAGVPANALSTWCAVSHDPFDAEVSWGVLLDGDIKFSLGKFSAKATLPAETKKLRMKWNNDLVRDRLELDQKCRELELRVSSLQKSKSELIADIESWHVKQKEEESLIFTKFVQILNQKKRKIKSLQLALSQHAAETELMKQTIQELQSRQSQESPRKKHKSNIDSEFPPITPNPPPPSTVEIQQQEKNSDSDDDILPSLWSSNVIRTQITVASRSGTNLAQKSFSNKSLPVTPNLKRGSANSSNASTPNLKVKLGTSTNLDVNTTPTASVRRDGKTISDESLLSRLK